MEDIVFQAKRRDVIGKQVRALRRDGLLPAVIYGHKMGSIPISLDFRSTAHILPGISSSHLVKVVVDGKEEHTTLVRERQRHPITGELLHLDFLAVSMTEKLRAMVSLVLHGDAPAMKNYNAVMVTGQEVVEVESLPGDLPERIEVDLSSLNEIGDGIYIRDLRLPAAVEILTPADEMIVLMTAPAVAPAAEEAEEAAAPEPEVIERGKREEEEF
jgi:large subunit ribosomal protein L25